MQIRKKFTKDEFKLPNCKYVIIDTDAGGDDAQCIILAVAEAKRTNKTILGITCVNGNATVSDVAINVLITLTFAGSKIPIYKGKLYLTQDPQSTLLASISRMTILVLTVLV